MGGLFGGGGSNASQKPAYTGLQIQTSVEGICIPVIYGKTRLAGNLLWYGNFKAVEHQANSGGKGGGSYKSVSYSYSTGAVIGLCEGPTLSVGKVWRGKDALVRGTDIDFDFYTGSSSQSADAWLASYNAAQALAYRRTCYVISGSWDLGSSADLPAYAFEISALLSSSNYNGDVNAAEVIADFLQNAQYGCGFPTANIRYASSHYFPTFRTYCQAAGFFVSPKFDAQKKAADHITDIVKACNAAFVWSEGVLDIVPFGDQNLTGNSATYTAPSAPLYDLTHDNFLAADDEAPVKMNRRRQADTYNQVKVEYLDRAKEYNPSIAPSSDLASVNTYGARVMSPIQGHFFCEETIAMHSAQLTLQRENIRNTYKFSLGWEFIGFDCMDIVTITDAGLGLDRQWVRIIEIEEDEEGALSIVAEEYLNGTGAAPIYGKEASAGYVPNFNAAAPNIDTPVFMEIPDTLAVDYIAPELWIGLSGADGWGGCDIWMSEDGSTYKQIGTQKGSSRIGALSASLASGSSPDVTHTLSVAMNTAEPMLSGTQADATNLVTLCYVDGEFIAYETATLTGAQGYDLTYLVRGQYRSAIVSHSAGAKFCRLDDHVFKTTFPVRLFGQTVYFKFVSFNEYGGGRQSIDTVEAHSFKITGVALKSPLPDITGLISFYEAGQTRLKWNPITDFRPFVYEIRQGANYDRAMILGTTLANEISANGDGTYWIAAKSDYAYSATPVSVAITGSVLTQNVTATYNEQSTGWTGTLSGAAGIDGSSRLWLTNTGGTLDGLTGSYEIPSGHVVNLGAPVPCNVSVSYQTSADSPSTSFDAIPSIDALASLDGAYAGYASVDIEINTSQDGSTWDGWRAFVIGQYIAQKIKFRVNLSTTSDTVTPVVENFTFTIDMPDVIEAGTNAAIANTGTAITFSKKFQIVPNVQVTILNAVAGDDVFFNAGPTAAGFTVQVKNGGAGVARNINWVAQGY